MFDEIDMIQSFPTDFMHNVCLGIVKDMIMIWTGRKIIPTPPFKEYMIKSKTKRDLLDKRFLNLKPPSFVRRKVRPISEVANFKASELLNCLWFYLRYNIPNLLPTKVVNHFQKLSTSTYVLCKENIEISEVREACQTLIKFCDEFEDIYGRGAVTLNQGEHRYRSTECTNDKF